MAAPKRSLIEREQSLLEIARLDRRGYSQNEIAERMGLSQNVINRDLKELRGRYRDAQLEETAASVYCKLLQYRELRKEAWEAWERSKEDAVRTITERTAPLRIGTEAPSSRARREAKGSQGAPGSAAGTADDLRTTRVATVVERRLPATEYLKTICDCLKAERELLGLDAPKKSQVAVHTLDWASLLATCEQTDAVEDRIEAALERTKGGLPDGLKELSVMEVVEDLDEAGFERGLLDVADFEERGEQKAGAK